MTNDERRFRRKSLAAVGIGIVASVAPTESALYGWHASLP